MSARFAVGQRVTSDVFGESVIVGIAVWEGLDIVVIRDDRHGHFRTSNPKALTPIAEPEPPTERSLNLPEGWTQDAIDDAYAFRERAGAGVGGAGAGDGQLRGPGAGEAGVMDTDDTDGVDLDGDLYMAIRRFLQAEGVPSAQAHQLALRTSQVLIATVAYTRQEAQP